MGGITMTEQRYPAGLANYKGDQRELVGALRGPTTYGTYVMAVDAEFDFQANLTTVRFEHLTEDEHATLMQMMANDSRLQT
jgi:hypothetical protein